MKANSHPVRLRFIPADGLRTAGGPQLRRLRRAALRALCDAGCGPDVFFHAFEHDGTRYGASARYLPERGQVIVEVGLLPPGLRSRTIAQARVERERARLFPRR